jgi:hypothetical protein
VVDKRLVANETEQKILARMRKLRAKGASYQKISAATYGIRCFANGTPG